MLYSENYMFILVTSQVPLGVLNKDEAKVRDMIDIIEEYQKYVPVDPKGYPQPTILYGDGLSCERHHDAQVSRANHDTPMGRLEGLHPGIQEWHHGLIGVGVLI